MFRNRILSSAKLITPQTFKSTLSKPIRLSANLSAKLSTRANAQKAFSYFRNTSRMDRFSDAWDYSAVGGVLLGGIGGGLYGAVAAGHEFLSDPLLLPFMVGISGFAGGVGGIIFGGVSGAVIGVPIGAVAACPAATVATAALTTAGVIAHKQGLFSKLEERVKESKILSSDKPKLRPM